MTRMDFLLIAPEIWVLTMTCVILFVDAFIKEERRGIVHLLGMVTLIFAAIITLRFDYGAEREAVAFAGSFIRDPMGDMLKLFSYFVLAMVFIYAKFCLRQFRMFRSDFYTLSLSPYPQESACPVTFLLLLLRSSAVCGFPESKTMLR